MPIQTITVDGVTYSIADSRVDNLINKSTTTFTIPAATLTFTPPFTITEIDLI